jgi:hypothetical protein
LTFAILFYPTRFFNVFLVIYLFSPSINAVIFSCAFNSNSCLLTSGSINSQADATVTAVTGTYPAGVTSSSITVIDGRNLIFRYFPRSITKFFPNIDVIFFEGGMREIHKEDLQQFSTKLKRVYLSTNVIEIIEKDLFIYNPNIEHLYIERNAIKYVDPSVFNVLTKLVNLGFLYNNCATGKVENDRNGVVKFIQEINANCSVPFDDDTKTILELQGLIDGLTKQNTNLTNNCRGSSTSGSGTGIFRIF